MYQAMRVIINDRRYGALKTLGERKQAFTEVNHYKDVFLCRVFSVLAFSLILAVNWSTFFVRRFWKTGSIF